VFCSVAAGILGFVTDVDAAVAITPTEGEKPDAGRSWEMIRPDALVNVPETSDVESACLNARAYPREFVPPVPICVQSSGIAGGVLDPSRIAHAMK